MIQLADEADVVGGYWLPREDTHMRAYLAKSGSYQRQKLLAAVRQTRRRRRAVDAGAHVGTWTLPLSRQFDVVEAFEPVPLHAACLRDTPRHVPNVVVHGAALSDGSCDHASVTAGKVGNTGTAQIVLDDNGTVPVATLDSFRLENVDLLKIDVEGHELAVLYGAAGTIRRDLPVIVMEEHDAARPAVMLLRQWGYVLRQRLTVDYLMVHPASAHAR